MNRQRGSIWGCGLLFTMTAMSALGSVLHVENPGFETAGADSEYAANWDYYEPELHMGIGRQWWAKRTGDWGLALYGWNAGDYGTAWQNDIAVNGGGGNRYTFSIWGLAEENFVSADHFVNIKIELKNSSGTVLEEETVNIYAAAKADPGNWNQYSVSIISENPDIAFVTPVLWSQAYDSGDVDPRSFYFDDVEMTQEWAVPEGSTSLLFIFGIALAFLLRGSALHDFRRKTS
ncbi:MAG: hypothetical protein PHP44_13805 [Kiritimatiellae bacterium]|nr:hypothetical protein [Kiritimatiellia bacterium]MDD4737166.1 hypothetical protein [Kiritimatiellia bacterium]